MDPFSPRSDSQDHDPVRLTRSKRLKVQSEGDQVDKSERRPRRNRTPARVFSPERWSKKERRTEKSERDSSFATLGIDLDITTESNRLLSRNSSFAASQIFNYTCLKPSTQDSLFLEPKDQEPQDDYNILLLPSSSPTRIPSPIESDSTEISFSPLDFLRENLSPLLSPIASPTQDSTQKPSLAGSFPSRLPLQPILPLPSRPIRFPSKSLSPRKLSPALGIFSDSSYSNSECKVFAPPPPAPPATIDPKLLTIKSESFFYSGTRAAQIGLEPKRGMRMLLRVKDCNTEAAIETEGEGRGVKRKRNDEEEEEESDEE